MATGAASNISASTLNPAAISADVGDSGRLGGARLWHPVHTVRGHAAARPRHRAHDKVAQAGRRGADLHPAEPAAGARRRQLQGPHPPARPRQRGDQRHQSERRGMVRVFGRLPPAHWRLKPERHLGLPGRHRSVIHITSSLNQQMQTL